MIKIVTCSIIKDYNFGGPSILIGFDELLKNIYHDEYELVNLQGGGYCEKVNDGIGIKTMYYYPLRKYEVRRFLFGHKQYNSIFSILKELKSADLIVDLYGICFCDHLDGGNANKIKYRLWDLRSFTISILSKKLLRKKVIKNTASYGPMRMDYPQRSARYLSEKIFDIMSARERLSKERLLEVCRPKRDVLIAPDTANLMPCEIEEQQNRVAISISHRMEKQWESKEDYCECICKLCHYIHDKYQMDILLIPNECMPGNYNDVSVGEKIMVDMSECSYVSMLDSVRCTAMQIKKEIVSSRFLVGSRYHSCVAALSGGIPVIVIGWHNKYEELLKQYGQEKWIIPNGKCSSKRLKEMTDKLVTHYDEEREIVQKRGIEIKHEVIDAGKEMLRIVRAI